MENIVGIGYTEESNARFAALPPNKQRVAVALDGLKLLEARKITARRGRYFETTYDLEHVMSTASDGSFQETLKSVDMSKCEVCAKGLMFVCAIARRNQVTNADAREVLAGGWGGDELSARMGGLFSARQLRLMETEFEGRDIEATDDDVILPIMRMYNLRALERLTVILRNIVDHDGEFVPVMPSEEVLACYARNRLPRWLSPQRETVQVHVTARQIAFGDVTEPSKHPVALALHAAGLRRWKVDGDSIITGKSARDRMLFSAEVAAKVRDMDEGRQVQPFSFEVSLR